MIRGLKTLAIALASVPLVVGWVGAQPTSQAIEDELVLITPVAKTLADGPAVAYGRIIEWKGQPEVDIFWGGESARYDKLVEQKLLAPLSLLSSVMDAIPASIGKPKPIYLKDPKGFWTGTVLEPYGLVYQLPVHKRLGVTEPKDRDDLLHPKLKGQVAQCALSGWRICRGLCRAQLHGVRGLDGRFRYPVSGSEDSLDHA